MLEGHQPDFYDIGILKFNLIEIIEYRSIDNDSQLCLIESL